MRKFANALLIAVALPMGALRSNWQGVIDNITAAALGEPQPAEDAVERAASSKAALVEALRKSNEYCAKAYAISGASAGVATELFGSPSTRVGPLALNAVHDGEHYGNIITYYRMMGKVPPSSRR